VLFNSFEYFLLFLPLTAVLYFFFNRLKLTEAAIAVLIFASFFFYAWWEIRYLPILLFSIIFNFTIGKIIRHPTPYKKTALIIGIITNVCLLAVFKYADFFIENLNHLSSNNIALLHLTLPLAISFFTFQQIAYLVDSYKGLTKEYDFLRYALFVTFFPQLIAGPIVHHKEMIPQFMRSRNKLVNYHNISLGLFIFAIGLFKKVVIADYFAETATPGFDEAVTLSFFDAWATSLAYTFQLYFDFSGYTDMAIGSALIFNIKLPTNFNSPYKATDIQDFWRRWHITLSRFLRDYIYIPLGGKNHAVYRNLMLTFIIGGFWHGAGWNFLFWGFLHGLATIVHRLWQKLNRPMGRLLGWFITFNFINITWVFFRATTWDDAMKVLQGMAGMNGIHISNKMIRYSGFDRLYEVYPNFFGTITAHRSVWLYLIVALVVVFKMSNSIERLQNFKTSWINLTMICTVFIYAMYQMNKVSEFLYFNF